MDTKKLRTKTVLIFRLKKFNKKIAIKKNVKNIYKMDLTCRLEKLKKIKKFFFLKKQKKIFKKIFKKFLKKFLKNLKKKKKM